MSFATFPFSYENIKSFLKNILLFFSGHVCSTEFNCNLSDDFNENNFYVKTFNELDCIKDKINSEKAISIEKIMTSNNKLLEETEFFKKLNLKYIDKDEIKTELSKNVEKTLKELEELYESFQKIFKKYKENLWNYLENEDLDAQKPNNNPFPKISEKLIIENNELLKNFEEEKIVYGNIQLEKKGHKDWINTLIYQNDKLYSCSDDKSIIIWDLKTENKVNIQNSSEVKSMLILNEKNFLVTGDDDGKINFWDLTDYSFRNEIDNKSPISIMLKLNSNTIISGSGDEQIKFWDINDFSLIKTLFGHSNYVSSLLIADTSNSNEILVSGSEDWTIKIWTIDRNDVNKISNEFQRSLDGHKGAISSLIQLEFNKEIIVSAGEDGYIIFWNINNNFNHEKICEGKPQLAGYGNNMCLLEIKQSHIMISGSWHKSLSFWNLKNYQLLRTITLYERIDSIVQIDGNTVALNAKSNILIWK